MRSSKKLKANVSPHGWKKFICYYFTFAYGSREGEKKKDKREEREKGKKKKNYVLICYQDLIDNLQVWRIIIVQWGELLWNNIQTDIESI